MVAPGPKTMLPSIIAAAAFATETVANPTLVRSQTDNQHQHMVAIAQTQKSTNQINFSPPVRDIDGLS